MNRYCVKYEQTVQIETNSYCKRSRTCVLINICIQMPVNKVNRSTNFYLFFFVSVFAVVSNLELNGIAFFFFLTTTGMGMITLQNNDYDIMYNIHS